MRCALFFALFLFCAHVASVHADAPRGYIARPLDAGVAYSQRGRDAYTAGTWTLDEIAAANGALSDADEMRIYERARAAFEEAVDAEPQMYEAHTYLGYVHRKLGRFDEALRSYQRALELKPDYTHAIEYQGEAYLEMGDFQRARFNYLRLYALDRELAGKLLDAIAAWTRQAENADAPEIDAARAWVSARKMP